MAATTRPASLRVVTFEMSTLAGRPVSYTRPFNIPFFPAAPWGKIRDRQRRGAGTALMHAVLGAAEALDEPLVG